MRLFLVATFVLSALLAACDGDDDYGTDFARPAPPADLAGSHD